MTSETNDKIRMWEDYVEAARIAHGVPGMAVGMVCGSELAWFKGFGETEIGNGEPPHENSAFRVASNTKTVTATALMMLQESSMLTLDDPLLLYVPEFTSAAGTEGDLEDVTLRRIAAHYSGMVTEHPATDWDAPSFPTMATVLNRIDEVEIVIPIDRARKYSNLGYGFLGEAVSRLAGQTYERFVGAEIFDPLGMSGSTFDIADVADENRVVGYSPTGDGSDELTVAAYAPLNGLASAGQLITSVADLSKWLAHAMHSGTGDGVSLLDARSRRELLHPAYLDADWTAGYCAGWGANRVGERVYHGHGGAVHGFGTQTMFHVPFQTGVIVLTNRWPNALSAYLAQTLLDAVIDDWDEMPPLPPPKKHDVPPSDETSPLRAHEGVYRGMGDFWIRITAMSENEIFLGGYADSPHLLHAPATARLESGSTFRVLDNRGAGERFTIADGEFGIGGIRYRYVGAS